MEQMDIFSYAEFSNDVIPEEYYLEEKEPSLGKKESSEKEYYDVMMKEEKKIIVEDEEKKENKKEKSIGILKIGEIYAYKGEEYLCLGAKKGEDRKISDIISIKLEDFKKLEGNLEPKDLKFFSVQEMRAKTEFPINSFPGYMTQYWLDIKNVQYHLTYKKEEHEEHSVCKTNCIKKTKYGELLRDA